MCAANIHAIDVLSFKLLDQIVKLEQETKRAADNTESEPDLPLDTTFVTISADERVVPLIEHGEVIPVTWSNRSSFVQALVHYRLHEFDVQCAAILRGLRSVVPGSWLLVLSWQQLRRAVCGRATVDVPLLKSVTQYEGCAEGDMWVSRFWKVLEQFDERQRSQFIRFVSGRSRF